MHSYGSYSGSQSYPGGQVTLRVMNAFCQHLHEIGYLSDDFLFYPSRVLVKAMEVDLTVDRALLVTGSPVVCSL